jgi:hypothetical protein
MLALEPEAASIYCRRVPVSVETVGDGCKVIATMHKGAKYVVFDQGGKYNIYYCYLLFPILAKKSKLLIYIITTIVCNCCLPSFTDKIFA